MAEGNADQDNLGEDKELTRCLSDWGVAVNSTALKVEMIRPKISTIGSEMNIDRYVTQL